jgi:hypothetical protein
MKKKEELFSDFIFAPSVHAVNYNPTMINGSDFTNTNNTDDDDWGDFNFVSSNSSGLSHALSLPRISNTDFEPSTKNQKVIESLTDPASAPSLVNKLTQWDKPKGALPLSIFGEIEEEEEEGSGSGEPRKNESFDFLKNKEGSGVIVSDLIANLYKEKERNNGFRSNFNGPDLNLGNLNGNGLNVNGVNKGELDSKGLGLDLKENGLNSNKMESNLIKRDGNLSGNGVDFGLVHGNEGFDDDKWEFEGADSKTVVEIEISKVKF